MFLPGIGGLLGGLIGGSGGIGGLGGLGGFEGLGAEAIGFLEIQKQLQKEQRAFELASSVLKLRHDVSISAIKKIA
jgi:hypothetical protein